VADIVAWNVQQTEESAENNKNIVSFPDVKIEVNMKRLMKA
jgi:hypothetical protein